MTQAEAIIKAFKALGGTRNKYEIEGWVSRKYRGKWKDFGTSMADMVPISRGGSSSSNVREELRVLERVHLESIACCQSNFKKLKVINMTKLIILSIRTWRNFSA